MTSTKFVLSLVGITGLMLSALLGKFTGELGLYVTGIIGAYVTGNTMITKASLSNGKSA
jgi:hypothetical protein